MKVKDVYFSLTEKELLERCLMGMTQNANESLHSKIWGKASKIKFIERRRLQFITQATVIYHNIGYKKGSLLKYLRIGTQRLDESLEIQDRERERQSKRKSKRMKRSRESSTGDYEAGGFNKLKPSYSEMIGIIDTHQ